MNQAIDNFSLSRSAIAYLVIFSLFCVGFGQPAWSPVCAILASTLGFALFFRVLLAIPSPRNRFWTGTLWFTFVQLIQLSWMLSHPFLYIYPVYLLISFAMGLQFGLIGLCFTTDRILQLRYLLGISGFWVLLEWLRLFFLSGFSFNPVGLALTSNLYALQFASIAGVYGLSLWVFWVNLLALRAWLMHFNWKGVLLWLVAALVPYAYGAVHFHIHDKNMALATNKEKFYKAILVQPAFPIEESLGLKDPFEMLQYVIEEWKQILKISQNKFGTQADLIVLPEFVVPYGTYSFVYPSNLVVKAFRDAFGSEVVTQLPPLQYPYATEIKMKNGSAWMVNNAYWVQAIANVFDAEVIAGLEDAEDVAEGRREYYSSAIHFKPRMHEQLPARYEKRVLVPMGEYIPFPFLAKLAERYGITGSFTPGKEAKILKGKRALGPSICYEETYGHMMRENKQKGAEILVNLSSDVWYPNSQLVWQHFDHARLRTVENGLPLLRACNTGITAGLDSLGRVVGQLGDLNSNVESISDSLYVAIPTYSFGTLYSHVGDLLIVVISLFLLLGLREFRERP